MKQFENKVLFIKDEYMLEEVKGLIQKSGNNICEPFFYFRKTDIWNFLRCDNKVFKGFWIFGKHDSDQEITLDEFKELLKIK